jgi:hypothetical protein
MQTFLPYPDFERSAKCLDNKRLGKQRVEVLQIYRALTIPGYGWRNHPIVKMWKCCEGGLLIYGIAICKEWKARGFKDSLLPIFMDELKKHSINIYNRGNVGRIPGWIGNRKFHRSHKSNLLRKDPIHYGKFKWNVPNNLEYIWYVN